jgi:hypothetical protein
LLHLAARLGGSVGRTMDKPLYRAWTKGTAGEAGPPRYSVNWSVARRAWFEIFADRIKCGDWIIRREDVKEATLFETRQWFIPVYVLSLTTEEKTWQFGFNPWARIESYLPFPVKRERVRLRYSAFSVVIRTLLLAYVAYWLYKSWRS